MDCHGNGAKDHGSDGGARKGGPFRALAMMVCCALPLALVPILGRAASGS